VFCFRAVSSQIIVTGAMVDEFCFAITFSGDTLRFGDSFAEVINRSLCSFIRKLLIVFTGVTLQLFHLLNLSIVFLLTVFLFTLIIKTLPDGKVSIRDAFIGAAFTSVLFMFGKFLIAAYLGSTHIVSIYGAAGSVILILIWIYYSAITLYFGAEFTKVYAHTHGGKIVPNEYSEKIR
jgi:membrane protein